MCGQHIGEGMWVSLQRKEGGSIYTERRVFQYAKQEIQQCTALKGLGECDWSVPSPTLPGLKRHMHPVWLEHFPQARVRAHYITCIISLNPCCNTWHDLYTYPIKQTMQLQPRQAPHTDWCCPQWCGRIQMQVDLASQTSPQGSPSCLPKNIVLDQFSEETEEQGNGSCMIWELRASALLEKSSNLDYGLEKQISGNHDTKYNLFQTPVWGGGPGWALPGCLGDPFLSILEIGLT